MAGHAGLPRVASDLLLSSIGTS